MSNMDTSIHHVTRVNVQNVVKGNTGYMIVHVFCKNGEVFEYTLFAEQDENIAVTFGDPND